MTVSPPTKDALRRARLRVPVAEPTGPFGRLLSWASRRRYGAVLDNLVVLWHHKRALVATAVFEGQVERFAALDPGLRMLAVMRSASQIGCAWCLDFGYFQAHGQGLDLAKIRAVPEGPGSPLFDQTERLVLEFADAATATPPTVTDELVAELTDRLGVAGMVELATMVAVENQRSRFNHALGLTSQGFRDQCELPGD